MAFSQTLEILGTLDYALLLMNLSSTAVKLHIRRDTVTRIQVWYHAWEACSVLKREQPDVSNQVGSDDRMIQAT